MKLLKKNKIKNNLNAELKEMGVFSAVAGNQLPNQLQKRELPALFHLRCPSQSHQRSARGRTRLTTVTSISCRSFWRQLLYLITQTHQNAYHGYTGMYDISVNGPLGCWLFARNAACCLLRIAQQICPLTFYYYSLQQ